MLSVPQILQIAKISQYLAVADIAKGTIFSPVVKAAPFTPQIIYMERKALEYQYNIDPTDDSLRFIANYVYALCGKYALQAKAITGVGGIIAGVAAAGELPEPYDFEVSGTSVIADGESTIIFSEFIGFNLQFDRGNIPQSTTNTGASYYSWNRNTGEFICFPAATTGELFRIVPV